jgi:hypothetical protein
MKLTRLLVVGAAMAALCASAACDRTYMTPTHGRAYREAFAKQTVNPDRQSEAKAVHGLDSQEAAIISASYRKALSPKDEAAANAQGPMLMYAPRGAAGQQGMPPPSVPDR